MFWNKKDEYDKYSIRIFIYKGLYTKGMSFECLDLSFVRDKDAMIPVQLFNGSQSSINSLEKLGYNVTVLVDNEIGYCTRTSNLKAKQEPNLLEIKLKDTDSVPEVWYRGERVDELPNGLVDVYMHWHTREFNKPAKLLAALEYIEGIDTDAKRIEISIDEEGECGYFNLLKDEIDD